MKLKFNKLQYQQDAINSIIDVLNGTYAVQSNDGFSNPILEFNEVNLCSLISHIQKKHNLDKLSKFEYNSTDGLNLDIMMETGTGKTITFIETMYRLNKEFGISKFVIVVPSNAIRLGTVKNISITKEYFKEYNTNISVFDSNNVYGFINSNNQNINVLITTFQAFNSKKNTIHKNNIEQNLFGSAKSYMDAIKNLHPVIIIDEPHRADGDKTQIALKKFESQLTLRFGATFNDYKNLIYSLDSRKAFQDGLVKSITVNSIGTTYNLSIEYVGNRKIKYALGNNSQTKVVKEKDDLGVIFNDESLRGYIVDKLGNSPNPKCIKFDNGLEIYPDEPILFDYLKEEVTQAMVAEAIDTHFMREITLFSLNIKVLSLFFIDNVDSYYKDKNKDGTLAKLFERLYKQKLTEVLASDISPDYRNYLEQVVNDVSQVHNGYFAKSNSDKDNQEEIKLILEKKEQLLSFETPLRFIFSKWALREGWDNPNIFVLTKLSPSNSKVTKLQQIGRGLRLAVDTFGNRITSEHQQFDTVNDLEVIIPKVENNFVKSIQEEIDTYSVTGKLLKFNNDDLINAQICSNQRQANQLIEQIEKLKIVQVDDDYNCEVICSKEYFSNVLHEIEDSKLRIFIANMFNTSNKIKEKRKNIVETTINKEKFNQFKSLWSYINSKTVVKYDLDSSILICNIVSVLNKELNITPIQISKTITLKAQDHDRVEKDTVLTQTLTRDNAMTLKEFVGQISLKTKLTQRTILSILQQLDLEKFNMLRNNFRESIQFISNKCISEIHSLMIKSIKFDIIETNIRNTALTDKHGQLINKINAYALGKDLLAISDLSSVVQNKSLYNEYIAYDSVIEKTTIKDSNISSIKVFAKLPKIRIKTPIGEYNPDFAYLLEDKQTNKEIFLIVETKGYDVYDGENGIPQEERQKITVGEKFFKSIQQKYPNINIKFKTHINTTELSQIISEVINNDKN